MSEDINNKAAMTLLAKERFSNDEIITFVQVERLKLVCEELDLDTKKSLLSDLAHTAIQDKKIQSDNKNANEDRALIQSMNTVLSSITQNPFKQSTRQSAPPIVEVEEITPLPGETHIGNQTITLEEIMHT